MYAGDFIANEPTWSLYLDANREVPGGIPENVLFSCEWRTRFAQRISFCLQFRFGP